MQCQLHTGARASTDKEVDTNVVVVANTNAAADTNRYRYAQAR